MGWKRPSPCPLSDVTTNGSRSQVPGADRSMALAVAHEMLAPTGDARARGRLRIGPDEAMISPSIIHRPLPSGHVDR
jgi:hypothetical protein